MSSFARGQNSEPGGDAFRHVWFKEWGFSDTGKPEDAASYIEGVLAAIADREADKPRAYIEAIGGADGQQEFVFQWLQSAGLTEGSGRHSALSERGQLVLSLLKSGSYYDVFCGDDLG